MPQFLRLPSMQAGRDGEGGIHAYYSGIEIEFGHAFEAARGTLFNADTASFAIVHENLVETVRPCRTDNAGLRTDEITVVTRVAGAATETPAGLLDRLLFREGPNHFLLRLAPAGRG